MQPAIVGMNYFRAQINVDDGSGVLATAYKGQTTGLNQLGVDGILPDDRGGQVTALMGVNMTTLTSTSADMAMLVRDHFNEVRDLEINLFLSNNEHIHGPFGAFPHPPVWAQGAVTSDILTNNTLSVQNAGFMLANLAHDIEPRMSVKVVVEKATGTAAFELTGGADLQFWLQTADARPISAS